MKRFLIGALLVVAGLAVGVTVVAAKYQPTIRPNTVVGQVPVGGLTREEAQRRVRIWWESEKLKKLTLTCSLFKSPLPEMTPGELGITLDDVASTAPCEVNDFWDAASQKFSGEPNRVSIPIVYKAVGGAKADDLNKRIKNAIGAKHPARISYAGGVITRVPEVTSFQLDDSKLSDAVTTALQGDGEVVVPVAQAAKHLPDEELAKITDVVSEYQTHFPSYQSSRNTNIRLASAKLNGHILMPGETLSFNKTVGQRTVEDGYRTAPVLKDGKHDVGIGGGICQVSTTLYNATLLGNLKIVRRHNHSVPSVYVPVGRDATVDWPDLDLEIQNNMATPIAISSTYEDGSITFRILGKKDPSQSVKIVTSGLRSWGIGEQVIRDPSMAAGRTRVEQRGSAGRAIFVERIVYKDGKEVRREPLGTSTYPGMKRIVVEGSRRVAPKVATVPNPATPQIPEEKPADTVPPIQDTPPTGGGDNGGGR